jgi:glutamate dehydrogenase
MNIDPRGGCTDRVRDLGTSIDAFGDEDAARQLLEDATTILQSRVANAPPDFVMQVFAGAAPEDLVRYEASEIAEIAAGTWQFLSERQRQTPKIQAGSAQSTPGQRLKSVSIIEVLNDDMPFLVDSVMAELAEQGFDPHLAI